MSAAAPASSVKEATTTFVSGVPSVGDADRIAVDIGEPQLTRKAGDRVSGVIRLALFDTGEAGGRIGGGRHVVGNVAGDGEVVGIGARSRRAGRDDHPVGLDDNPAR